MKRKAEIAGGLVLLCKTLILAEYSSQGYVNMGAKPAFRHPFFNLQDGGG
ncbi:hypothetical protein [Lentibacillus amyloliquefaciens]|nr:hypothetical protein [Lentibacillus amyloliquefaciens]